MTNEERASIENQIHQYENIIMDLEDEIDYFEVEITNLKDLLNEAN